MEKKTRGKADKTMEKIKTVMNCQDDMVGSNDSSRYFNCLTQRT